MPRTNFVRSFIAALTLGTMFFGWANPGQAQVANNRVRIVTSQGSIDVELYTNDAPITVNNFLSYATANDYNNVIFHRLAYIGSTPFVLQGGGFYPFERTTSPIPTVTSRGAITNEFSHSNVAGTIAMAKLGGDPNSATDQFFFNLSDNSSNLDNQNGGFTVFGKLINGQTTLDKLAAITPNSANVSINDLTSSIVQSDPNASAFDSVPLINYPGGTQAYNNYFEKIYAVVLLPNGTQPWKLTTGGAWDNGANWQWGQTPLYTAVLGNSLVGAGTIDLGSSSRAVNTLRFSSGSNNGAYTLSSTTGGSLAMILLGGVTNSTIQIDSSNTQTQTISAAMQYLSNTTINNQSGNGAALVLSGAQMWLNRAVTVSAGKVKFDNATTTNAFNATLTIAAGASLELAGSSSGTTGVAIANNGTMNATGTNQSTRAITGTGMMTVSVGGTLTADSVTQTTLIVNGNSGNTTGSLTIRASGSTAAGNNSGTSHVGSLSIANDGAALPAPPAGIPYSGALRTYYSTLDLKNNDLVVTNGTLEDITDMIRAGEGSTATPNWTGRGLTSSYAASSSNYALGVIRNDNNPLTATLDTPLYTSFSGVTGLSGNEVLVKFTYYGDLNLDGVVNSVDTALYDAGVGGAVQADGLPGWYYGDVNYDGAVNAADLALITAGHTFFTSGGSVPLPEPSSVILGVLGIVGLVVASRRRRS